LFTSRVSPDLDPTLHGTYKPIGNLLELFSSHAVALVTQKMARLCVYTTPVMARSFVNYGGGPIPQEYTIWLSVVATNLDGWH
jgi:hypothetical protein